MLSKRLKWVQDDFNQQQAEMKPYRFIVWQGKEYAELRIIRREHQGGVTVPVADFSIYAKDVKRAKRTGEKIAKALVPTIEYNDFVSPF
jgi:hypothetical protein